MYKEKALLTTIVRLHLNYAYEVLVVTNGQIH
jgi:hypothetical protein